MILKGDTERDSVNITDLQQVTLLGVWREIPITQ